MSDGLPFSNHPAYPRNNIANYSFRQSSQDPRPPPQGSPPPGPLHQHDPRVHYGMTPVMETHNGYQQPICAQACSFCKESDLVCQYPDTQPAKTEKNTGDRSYSVDSTHPQRTPATPAQHAAYPPSSAPDVAHLHMEHHGYMPVEYVTHGLPQSSQGPPLPPPPQRLPPPGPPPQHDPHVHYRMTPMMENHNGHQPHIYAQAPGYSLQAVSTNFNAHRKKQMRATQACEKCRQWKRKCDQGNPCTSCKENDLPCRYSDTPPAKTDKNMDKVIAMVEQVAQGNQDLRQVLDTELGRSGDQLQRTGQHGSSSVAPSEPFASEERALKRKQELEEHRTAPHKLIFLWPSLRPLLQAANVDVNDGYVMKVENRGLLRLYGRGEDAEDQDGTQPGGPASPTGSESSFSEASLTPEGIWGCGHPTYAYPTPELRSHLHTAGGLKPDRTLDLDKETILKLWGSYVKHMHIMHPFLDKARTHKLINNFIARYCPNEHRTHDPWAVGGGESDRQIKRQRSGGPTGSQGIAAGECRQERFVETERSPSNAIIYLVLALGKICTFTENLSGSRRLSSATQTVSNMEIIPGIAYYAKGAEILGDQGDGNDLIHAQMFLLAGLYKGQLARVKESMTWIAKAGQVVQGLLDRHKLYNDKYWASHSAARGQHGEGQKLIADKRQNLIIVASWTCLQLESDILAELPLPSSGIQNIEDLLLMPHNLAEEEMYEGFATHEDKQAESYDNVILFYTAQMFLRKRLNQVHRQLYGPDCLNQPLAEVQAILHGHEAILHGWRAMLPPDLKWVDDEPPPKGILSARLRAKYWGARYLVNRPYLDYALHIMPHVKAGRSIEEAALDVHRNPRVKAEIHIFKAIKSMGESQVWASSRQCIEAAMQSTVALDGVPDRLIVTNIHGTAHAQFGNMLVLSATWCTEYLRKLIDQERFRRLLARTIIFLRRLAPISPTCQIDCSILEKIQHVLFVVAPGEGSMR